jgi:hypothetical protein
LLVCPGIFIRTGIQPEKIKGEFQMKEQFPKFFSVSNMSSGREGVPEYILRDGQVFRTAFHPRGWSEYPDYLFYPDGKFYRTRYHESGEGELPDYIIGPDKKLYRTDYHPKGYVDTPDFEIRD